MLLVDKNYDFYDLYSFYLQVVTLCGIDTACEKVPDL